MGGGKHKHGTSHLAKSGIDNLVLDPFNRDREHNQRVLDRLVIRSADGATLSNFLNIVPEVLVRTETLRLTHRLVRDGAKILVSIHPGDRSSPYQGAPRPAIAHPSWRMVGNAVKVVGSFRPQDAS
jgi:hypothetical protein